MGPLVTITVSRSPRLHVAFRYLWLKYVTGFDDQTHCLACLRGGKSSRVGLDMAPGLAIRLDEHEAPYLYLCGGADRYENNLHVALRPKRGGRVGVTAWNGMLFMVQNAERLAIPKIPAGHLGYALSQTTCRNFQFGLRTFGSRPDRAGPVVGRQRALGAADAKPARPR